MKSKTAIAFSFVSIFLLLLSLVIYSINNKDNGRRRWVVIKKIEKTSLKAKTLDTNEFIHIQTESPENLVINLKRCSTKDFQIEDTVMFVNLKK